MLLTVTGVGGLHWSSYFVSAQHCGCTGQVPLCLHSTVDVGYKTQSRALAQRVSSSDPALVWCREGWKSNATARLYSDRQSLDDEEGEMTKQGS